MLSCRTALHTYEVFSHRLVSCLGVTYANASEGRTRNTVFVRKGAAQNKERLCFDQETGTAGTYPHSLAVMAEDVSELYAKYSFATLYSSSLSRSIPVPYSGPLLISRVSCYMGYQYAASSRLIAAGSICANATYAGVSR